MAQPLFISLLRRQRVLPRRSLLRRLLLLTLIFLLSILQLIRKRRKRTLGPYRTFTSSLLVPCPVGDYVPADKSSTSKATASPTFLECQGGIRASDPEATHTRRIRLPKHPAQQQQTTRRVWHCDHCCLWSLAAPGTSSCLITRGSFLLFRCPHIPEVLRGDPPLLQMLRTWRDVSRLNLFLCLFGKCI